MQSKLSRHQKMILQILAEEITDEIRGFSITMLSKIAARKLETEPGSYVENSTKKKAEILTDKWRASFTRCLKRLEDRGLIIRSIAHVGGRTHRIVLTPEGREIAERA